MLDFLTITPFTANITPIMANDKTRARITFDLSPELDETLESIAEEIDESKSTILRGLIRFAIRWAQEKAKGRRLCFVDTEGKEIHEVDWFV